MTTRDKEAKNHSSKRTKEQRNARKKIDRHRGKQHNPSKNKSGDNDEQTGPRTTTTITLSAFKEPPRG